MSKLALNKEYTEKDPYLDADDLHLLMDNGDERALRSLLRFSFTCVPEDLQQPNIRACQAQDLVAQTARKGWHESLRLLLDNNCGVVPAHNTSERVEYLMWAVASGLEHAECVRTLVDYMVYSEVADEEYVAREICTEHPHIWPTVADVFSSSVQHKANQWAATGQTEHKDGNYEVIFLWVLEQELKRISKRDTILKHKAFQQCIYGSYSKFTGRELLDIARWAVMGNLPHVFAAVENTFDKDNPKNKPWVLDAPVGPKLSDESQSALNWLTWKKAKIQLSYTYNTPLANTLLGALITLKSDDANRKPTWYSDVGVKLWLSTKEWAWLERLRKKSPQTAESILWHLPFDAVVEQSETLFQYKNICQILHNRWFGLNSTKAFCFDLFKHTPRDYQQKFVSVDSEYKQIQRQNSEDFHKNLRARQNAVKRPQGLFDTVISGFANPNKNFDITVDKTAHNKKWC